MGTTGTARRALVSLALGAPLLLAGCGEPVPDLQIGSPAPSGERLSPPPPPGAQLSVADWPDACQTLSDAEIQAMLPQANDVERTPQELTIMNFNPLQESDPGATGDIPAGGCEYRFTLPAEHSPEGNSSIDILLASIADPALIEQSYREDLADDDSGDLKDLGDSLGAAGCFTDTVFGGMDCYQGAYRFEVSGTSTADGMGEYPESEQNWTDQVLGQVVATLAARAG